MIQQLSHMELSCLLLGRIISFNLLYDEDFTIPYVNDTIPNSPAGYQLPTQAKLNVWIIYINR